MGSFDFGEVLAKGWGVDRHSPEFDAKMADLRERQARRPGRYELIPCGPPCPECGDNIYACGHAAQDKLLSANENIASEGQTQASDGPLDIAEMLRSCGIDPETTGAPASSYFEAWLTTCTDPALKAEVERALEHLGNVLTVLAELEEGDRCRALDEALAFYNERRPNAQIEPVEGYSSRLVHSSPISRAVDAAIASCEAAEVERLRAEVVRLRQSVADDELRAVEWDEELTAAHAALSTAREDALEEAAQAVLAAHCGIIGYDAIRALTPPQRPHSEAGAAIPPARVHRDTSGACSLCGEPSDSLFVTWIGGLCDTCAISTGHRQKAEMTNAEYQRLTGPYAALEGDA